MEDKLEPKRRPALELITYKNGKFQGRAVKTFTSIKERDKEWNIKLGKLNNKYEIDKEGGARYKDPKDPNWSYRMVKTLSHTSEILG